MSVLLTYFPICWLVQTKFIFRFSISFFLITGQSRKRFNSRVLSSNYCCLINREEDLYLQKKSFENGFLIWLILPFAPTIKKESRSSSIKKLDRKSVV